MRVLVTGSTGLLAKGFEETADDTWEIVGVHQREYVVPNSKVSHHILDVSDTDAVDAFFDREQFDAVIHAAGMASVDQVERHPDVGRRSNLEGTRNVARAAERQKAHFVHISTNAVFDGESAPYSEKDATHPIHAYGRIKLECEKAAQAEVTDLCIVRPILMYGWNHRIGRPNPVTWIYETLLRGESLPLVDDVYENPLYNLQCGDALWAILAQRAGGIFHLAGDDSVNRCELGRRVAEVFDLDASLIQPVPSSHFPSIAPRPKNTTFATGRMQKLLGIAPMTLCEGLLSMRSAIGIAEKPGTAAKAVDGEAEQGSGVVL